MAGPPKGNTNAKGKRYWSDAVRKALAQTNKGNKTDNLAVVAEKLVSMAIEGDLGAIRELGDRTEGKAVAEVLLSGHLSLSEQTDKEIDDRLDKLRELQQG